MKFTPKTEKQLKEDRLIPDGEYSFEISNGLDKTSKSGNDMIELILRVYKDDGNFILVTDYLLESMAFKLRHAAEACGLLAEYDGGILVGDNFVGKTGVVKIKTQVDKTGQFADRNVVADYIIPKAGEVQKPVPKKDDLESDSIPF